MTVIDKLFEEMCGIATEAQGEPDEYEVALVKQPDGTYKGRD